MRLSILIALSACFCNTLHADPVYPVSRTVSATTQVHGVSIDDPYQWLENLDSAEVKEWIAKQNETSNSNIRSSGLYQRFHDALDRLGNAPEYSLPQIRAGREIWLESRPGLEQSLLQVRDTASQVVQTLVDPNELRKDGSLAVSHYKLSPNGQLVAYKLRIKGSQTFRLLVARTENGERVSEVLDPNGAVGSENLVWSADSKGLYYAKTIKPSPLSPGLPPANSYEGIYYHAIGTDSASDVLVFSASDNKTWRFGPAYVGDGYLACLLWEKSAQKRGMVLVPHANGVPQKGGPVFIDSAFVARSRPLGFSRGNLLSLTNDSAPNQKVVLIDPAHPQREAWKVIVPESQHTIDGAVLVNDKIVVSRLADVTSALSVYDVNGNFLAEVNLPGIGVITHTLPYSEGDSFLFAFDSLISPRTIYELNLSSFKYSVRTPAQIPFDSNRYTFDRVFFEARDGARIPIFIAMKTDRPQAELPPMLLTGYGGFNYSYKPRFGSLEATWLELGGSLAIANIRGGGEYGEAWHRNGMLLNKQNAFNDFVDAANWLIDHRYVNPRKIAIVGMSNGGLLVSAAVNQSPQIFGAVVNSFGLTDMIRNESAKTKFNWTDEFGSIADERHFQNLLSYSPLHNIKANVDYPPILVQAAELDDRVLPWHQYKYIAALQNLNTGRSKKLLSVSLGSGHAFGKSASTLKDESSILLTFIATSLGMVPNQPP